MTASFIFCASITAISAVISLGFSIEAALRATGTAHTMALYACARSVALVIASGVPFLTGSTEWLQAIAWSMIIVQACDAVIGTTIKSREDLWPSRNRLIEPGGGDLANPSCSMTEIPDVCPTMRARAERRNRTKRLGRPTLPGLIESPLTPTRAALVDPVTKTLG